MAIEVRYNFKQKLTEAVKVAGEMLIENAEDIAGNTDYMTDLSIDINFNKEYCFVPEVTIKRSHVPSKANVDRIFDAGFTKVMEETNND